LNKETALIQTVDFLTPVVDDPYLFGQIAAANSLSDVYAMGGSPIAAMNLVSFPVNSLDISILKGIIEGGLEKIHEAGASLVGGHSVDDKELKYGLSVTGIVHPDEIWSNKGARLHDKILLTKPLGLGVLNSAIKGGIASKEDIGHAIKIMIRLNRISSEVMKGTGGIHTCTDVTGFGLIGHLYNICKNSNVSIRLYTDQIPVIEGVYKYAKMGLLPGALHANRKFYKSHVEIRSNIPEFLLDILYDPQTSGGLIIFADPQKHETLLNALWGKGESWSRLIGEVITEPGDKIVLE